MFIGQFSSQIIIRTFRAAKGHNEDPGLRREQHTHGAVQGSNSFFEHTHMIHVYRSIFQGESKFRTIKAAKGHHEDQGPRREENIHRVAQGVIDICEQ